MRYEWDEAKNLGNQHALGAARIEPEARAVLLVVHRI
jgi:hypothetical protein